MSPARKIFELLFALVLLAVIAWFDYITGYEISVFVLYAIPIAWIAWSLNLAWGLSFSLFGTAAWRWADFASGHRYSRSWIGWEKALTGLILFAFIAFSFNFFKKTLHRGKQKVKQLEGILPICMVCHRIRDEKGDWGDLDAYLRTHSDAEPERKVCPDCGGAKYLTDYSM